VRLLLDTHVLLWLISEPSRIRSPLRRRIERADLVYVSSVSVLESFIKFRIGKLSLPPRFVALIGESGFKELAVTFQHAAAVETLPRIHKDPFDQVIIAQALCEGLPLVTADKIMARYPIEVIWS
jgi:PIN domain nuclease of toxin-antitoxin system